MSFICPCFLSPVAPRFVLSPSDRVLLGGFHVLLRWRVEAKPDPQITWFINGRAVIDSDSTFIWLKDGILFRLIYESLPLYYVTVGYNITDEGLRFVPQWPGDTGRYAMEAKNAEGQVKQSAMIDVISMSSSNLNQWHVETSQIDLVK